ncbi:uncharacterized protein LOC128214911 [Mya arenaria]|uniref:uncharacterized protein LOC128214911 n=1 Tax=Mya arenaria TaxID=6604 RepID=UPI0022DF2B5B|nr:uncharacterized protein LOC128214911 [Mya arenaria]XP_052777578.1 uncharacterized protein LOC128214911 [Mya arenaria]XP_052777579.1 uncharacterized protein LOC128214911 [Mya arenaria]XP_052777580.1 uncharacterized protein LOC128214911 [Mya arenaria]XP_052777581.1 uncharacterized protein LOC128214911 [Mya arenaria]XP_052777582.1 uncharacterized protein LOC128214911 [Mya arenaria]XP_052777583.1 uncharacterized protein LOC128214911 [Mya arenaria]XP_052777584.1 uncharacterized protein LOC1282
MGTVYLIASSGFLLVETILQLCVVGTHSSGSGALFVVLLALVMAPLIVINFVSAIQVTRTKDFTGKSCGRSVCIGFHSVQFGILWRALKLLILYDEADWLDFLNMRLFQCGFQSLPFCIVLGYSMFVTETKSALDIIAILISTISAAVALVTFRTGTKVYESLEYEERIKRIRLRVGMIVLTLSTWLTVVARCVSIILFSVSLTYWIFIPLGVHFFIHLLIESCNITCSEEGTLSKVVTAVYIAFVNVFDLVGKEYSGVKCSYVLYYSVMLIENLGLSFYWMLTANEEYGDQFKLMLVLAVILCFVFGLILKFASCGCIYNIESDILSDAFNNPELKDDKPLHKADQQLNNTIEVIADVNDQALYEHELPGNSDAHLNAIALTVDSSPLPVIANRRQKRPTLSSSTSSSMTPSKTVGEYENQAFVRSQGNVSLSSQHTVKSHKLSHGSSQHHSANNSQELSFKSSKSGSKGRSSKKKSEDECSRERVKPSLPVILTNSKEQLPDFKHNRIAKVKPTIIISDTSKHDTLPKQNNKHHPGVKESNLTLDSSHSKYSRNTHTMNGSERYYGYNGFEDPYRERRQLTRKPQNRVHHNRQYQQHQHHPHHQQQQQHHHHHQQQHQHHRHNRNMDYSLDSSELYPSMTSDTSSVSTYTDMNARNRRRSQQRNARRMHNYDSRDGYSTDVSNSDYLSFNDYSMEDSSSWTGSTESSSSDGAATWPPSQSGNLLKMYNIPDRESSTDNIIHWLEAMEHEYSEQHDASFSTLHERSLVSDTDISLSAMKDFEVKKEKKKFRRLMSKPKGLLLKFSSLNYKGKDKKHQERPYPLKKTNALHEDERRHQKRVHVNVGFESAPEVVARPPSTVPLPVDNVQESIV